MQVGEALSWKARARRRIVGEHGSLVHVAYQADAAAILQVDGGKQDQGRHLGKLPIRPGQRLAFSGGANVPTMLSHATMAVSGPP